MFRVPFAGDLSDNIQEELHDNRGTFHGGARFRLMTATEKWRRTKCPFSPQHWAKIVIPDPLYSGALPSSFCRLKWCFVLWQKRIDLAETFQTRDGKAVTVGPQWVLNCNWEGWSRMDAHALPEITTRITSRNAAKSNWKYWKLPNILRDPTVF